MTDIRLALMCGTDIPIPALGITLHQPKIKEIAFLGEEDFFVAVQCLNINRNMIKQDKNLLQNTNNFQIFMTIMSEPEAKEKKEATKQLLSLLFPNYKAVFSPRSLILQGENLITIDENNFDILQAVIIQVFCLNNAVSQQQGFNPANDKAREIAEKLMKGRQKVAELKGSDKASIFSQYLSILTVGLNSMSMFDCMNLTMYQLYDLIERYSLYVNWDMDVKCRLAGGKPDSQPDNWMKDIH